MIPGDAETGRQRRRAGTAGALAVVALGAWLTTRPDTMTATPLPPGTVAVGGTAGVAPGSTGSTSGTGSTGVGTVGMPGLGTVAPGTSTVGMPRPGTVAPGTSTVGMPRPSTRAPGTSSAPARPAPSPPLPCPPVRPGFLTATPPTAPRTVALTFDDGPSAWTPQFLAVLARYHVHGTFFMVGQRAAARPEVVAQVVAAGDLVGNHTWDHPLHPPLTRLPPARLSAEITQAQATLTRLAGSPPCFFRGPGEHHRSTTVIRLAHTLGLTVTDTTRTAGDAGNPLNARYDPVWRDDIVTRLTAAGDHPIVLMHDGHTDNKVNELSALERIIVWYRARGYVFTDPAGRPFR